MHRFRPNSLFTHKDPWLSYLAGIISDIWYIFELTDMQVHNFTHRVHVVFARISLLWAPAIAHSGSFCKCNEHFRKSLMTFLLQEHIYSVVISHTSIIWQRYMLQFRKWSWFLISHRAEAHKLDSCCNLSLNLLVHFVILKIMRTWK